MERVVEVAPLVVKRGGRRETFDRDKVLEGIRIACAKRPVSATDIERLADQIESQVVGLGNPEVAARDVGDIVLRGLRGMDAFSQQGWTAVIGVAPLLLASALIEPHPLAQAASASWVAWAGVAYAAVVASLLGHGIFYVLVQRHPVAQITPYLLATPLLAILLGIWLLHDEVGIRLWIGGAMVLGGVLAIALRNLAKSRPQPAPESL